MSFDVLGPSVEEIYGKIIQTLQSDGIALVHPHWLESKECEESINDSFIKFVHSIGGIPHSHSSCDNNQDLVWDVRPLADFDDEGRPARSLTADAFEMHTVCLPTFSPILTFLRIARLRILPRGSCACMSSRRTDVVVATAYC